MSTAAPTVVELNAGALRLELVPEQGGCINGLWLGELPVLRSVAAQTLQSARSGGCFALVPYSNRMGNRRFVFAQREHVLAPNFEGSPHSLHGVGWRRPWQLAQHSADRAVLHLVHRADAHWPFDFEVEQTVSLQPGALHLSMTVLNRHGGPAPVGLGWHPYFVRRSRSRLHAEIAARWETDALTQLPTHRVVQPGIDADVEHLRFDHCFEAWQGAARIRDERLSLALSSSLRYLVVYTPPLQAHFCVEPVSHLNNALQMADPEAHGMRVLEPGASASAWMRLDIAAA